MLGISSHAQSYLYCAARTEKSAILLFATLSAQSAQGEAMLQYFNTDWTEITGKMPELAEAGYSSLWLPPPTKGKVACRSATIYGIRLTLVARTSETRCVRDTALRQSYRTS